MWPGIGIRLGGHKSKPQSIMRNNESYSLCAGITG